jgi:hypothetical protein
VTVDRLGHLDHEQRVLLVVEPADEQDRVLISRPVVARQVRARQVDAVGDHFERTARPREREEARVVTVDGHRAVVEERAQLFEQVVGAAP